MRLMIIGPILKRAGGYVFDTWRSGEGLNPGYPYRRIEDANYARNAAIRSDRPVVCHTLDEFHAQTSMLAAA
jgi:hypothetical protein